MAPQAGLSTASKPGSQVASVVEGATPGFVYPSEGPLVAVGGILGTTQASQSLTGTVTNGGRKEEQGPIALAWVFPTLSNSHSLRIPPVWVTSNHLIFHLKSSKNKHIGTLKAPSI